MTRYYQKIGARSFFLLNFPFELTNYTVRTTKYFLTIVYDEKTRILLEFGWTKFTQKLFTVYSMPSGSSMVR